MRSGSTYSFHVSSPLQDSSRSRHYVAMDFTGKVGVIVDRKDICSSGYTSKDGYAYFRRKVTPTEVEPLLTEIQRTVHLGQPWFHKGIGRETAQRILAAHNIDGYDFTGIFGLAVRAW